MMDANGWLAAATGVYAAGTAALAWFTNSASRRAVQTSERITSDQIEATREATLSQIQASREFTADQIKAASNSTESQVAAAKDAALIQARAAAVSNNRQGWINQLRDEVTGFLTEAGMRRYFEATVEFSESREAQRTVVLRAMKSHLNKIRLLINPTEGESTELVEMLTRVYNHEDTSEAFEDAVISHTQAILKTEWERVKSGD